MPYFETNDKAKLFYEDKGQGRPLIMIPGWGCSRNFFKNNIDVLSQTCRVIALDLRGHGDSDNVEWGHRISRYAKDIKDLIEELGLENVTLLGWSMGASIIWSYIDLFGNEHLAGHVSVDQSPKQYYDETWRWGQPGCYDAESLAILTVRLEYDPEGAARGLVPACFGDTPPTAGEVEYFGSEIDKCPGRIRAMIMADHTHLDWRDLLPTIKLPVLVCVGRQSKVFPWEGSAYVGEQIPGAKTEFLKTAANMLFYTESEKFNRTVAEFVAGL